MNFYKQNILIVSPHQDDEVIGCGGLIQKIIQNGGRLHLAFGVAVKNSYQKFCFEDSKYKAYSGEDRMEEMYQCLDILGVKRDQITFLYKPEYHSLLINQPFTELLTRMEEVILEQDPDIILIPAISGNQDHEMMNRIVMSAMRPNFFSKNIIEYEVANELDFEPNLYVELKEQEIQKKVEAAGCYKTQYRGEISKLTEKSIRSSATSRGYSIHTDYAEAYQIKRLRVI